MDYTIRSMHENDIPRCAQITAEIPLWQRYGVTEQSVEIQLLMGMKRQRSQLFVAEVAGEAVGLIWCVHSGAFDRSGYIRKLMVAPAQQRMGIGGALLAHAEEALGRQSPNVFLLVSDFNTDAQRFYWRHGYEQVGALPGYALPDVTELIYRKRLPGWRM